MFCTAGVSWLFVPSPLGHGSLSGGEQHQGGGAQCCSGWWLWPCPALSAAVLLEWAGAVGKVLGLLLWLGTGIRALCHTGFIPCEGSLKISSGGAPWEVAEDALCTWSDGFVLTFKRSWS